jgi:hypothetical protein
LYPSRLLPVKKYGKLSLIPSPSTDKNYEEFFLSLRRSPNLDPRIPSFLWQTIQ